MNGRDACAEFLHYLASGANKIRRAAVFAFTNGSAVARRIADGVQDYDREQEELQQELTRQASSNARRTRELIEHIRTEATFGRTDQLAMMELHQLGLDDDDLTRQRMELRDMQRSARLMAFNARTSAYRQDHVRLADTANPEFAKIVDKRYTKAQGKDDDMHEERAGEATERIATRTAALSLPEVIGVENMWEKLESRFGSLRVPTAVAEMPDVPVVKLPAQVAPPMSSIPRRRPPHNGKPPGGQGVTLEEYNRRTAAPGDAPGEDDDDEIQVEPGPPPPRREARPQM